MIYTAPHECPVSVPVRSEADRTVKRDANGVLLSALRLDSQISEAVALQKLAGQVVGSRVRPSLRAIGVHCT